MGLFNSVVRVVLTVRHRATGSCSTAPRADSSWKLSRACVSPISRRRPLTNSLTHTTQTHRLGKEAMTSTGGVHGTSPAPHVGPSRVSLHPLWEPSRALPLVVEHGSHGGGDTRMLNVLFGPRPGEAVDTGDASRQAATERDGTLALAVGLAANKSFGSGRVVKVAELALEG
jgi:hypothetical protein